MGDILLLAIFRYYVDNEGLGSLFPGLKGRFFTKTVFVHETDFERAQELLKDFLAGKDQPEQNGEEA